jgi:hypothetical protein
MAIISTYPIDGSVSLTDKLIGTDAEDSNKTKNYTVDAALKLLSEVAVALPLYGNNNDAIAGGLTSGQFYRSDLLLFGSNVVCIVV